MPISFAQIPQNIKVPLYWVEVDPSMAGLPSINLRALLIGLMKAGTPIAITAATWTSPNATYTTGAAHNLTVGEVVEISGITPSLYNGVFTTIAGTTGSTVVVAMAANPGTYVSGGQVVPANVGDAVPNVPIPIGSQAQSSERFGTGTELDRMFQAYFANNFGNEVWGCGVADDGSSDTGMTGGAAASGTITLTTPPTGAGTLHLYISGTHVPVNMLVGDTIVTYAADIVTAINADPTLPVTAKSTAGVVTLTANWKGTSGNEITVQANYYGGRGSEQLPVGLGIALPTTGQLTGGVGTPLFTNLIGNLGDTPFEYVALGYTDTNTIFSFDQEFGFTDAGRWGWQRQLFGHMFYARRGLYSDLITWSDPTAGNTHNSAISSVMSFEVNSPSPSFEWAAAYCAKAQRALINDPARPLQALTLNRIKMAQLHQQFDFVELNSLASNGLAIQKAGADTQPMILREQTLYQLNLWGATDDAYELVTTLATLAKLMRNQKSEITNKYPRHKLADDGTKFGPGQAIVTPSIIKSELISQYQIDMYNGLVENLQAFKAHLLVERDPNDPNRVNVLYPPDLINQLRIFAVLNQFRLQYNRGIDTEIIGPSPSPFLAASQSLG